MKSGLFTAVLRRRTAVFAGLAMATVMTAAHATDLVTNGSFESLQNPALGSDGIGVTDGQNQNVTGWTSLGYDFVFTPTQPFAADGGLSLYGPATGSNNGLGPSPDGGNFVAMDGAFEVGPLSQTINGLVAGATYAVSFYYAGAQQTNFLGPTTEAFNVSLGAQTIETPVLSIPQAGFSGWQAETLDFTATGVSETLAFVAVGTPNGQPPFTLLDGVSLTATPEPSSLAFLATGLLGVGGMVRRRFMKA
jgi:PEP-CTERM motif